MSTNEGPTAGAGNAPAHEALLAELPGATTLEPRADGLWMVAPALDVVAMAELMRRLGARLCAITGLSLASGEAGIVYHYCLGSHSINLRTDTRHRALPSVAPLAPAANWSEREIADLYGVGFAGHPDLTRLIRPPSLPQGFFRDATTGGHRGEDSGR